MDRPRILVLYGTGYGQTAKIAKRVGDHLTDRGCITDVRFGKNFSMKWPLEHYDGVVVGASVHMQNHQDYIVEFARAYAPFLEEIPTGFFSVSGAGGADSDEGRREARAYVDQFVERTGWQPDQTAAFGGALPYTRYGPVVRYTMKILMTLFGGDADTSRDYEYTDWQDVDDFAEQFFERLGVEPAPAPAPEERQAARRVGGHPRSPK